LDHAAIAAIQLQLQENAQANLLPGNKNNNAHNPQQLLYMQNAASRNCCTQPHWLAIAT
jgi:hypothetical protein